MEILNKQQFLGAVKEDSSLILQCDMHDEMIFFSSCSEPFTIDEYKDLCNQHIHDFEAYSALIDYLVQSSTEDTINAVARRIAYDNFMNHKELNELHFTTDEQGITSIPFKKWKMSYLSEPDIVPHKTGVPREMFISEIGKLYNKPSDRGYLKALGLTQDEIYFIVVEPQGTISKRYPTFADKKRKP